MQQSPSGQAQSSAVSLDLRELKAPENVIAVLKKASELPNGSTLQFQIDSNPFQLYDLLQQRGFFLRMERQTDGTYLGMVAPRDTKALTH